MSVRTIYRAGAVVLRTACRPVERLDASVLRLLDDLRDTAGAVRAKGLAAPQLGLLRRAVVVRDRDGWIELVNPSIAYATGREKALEACVSLPGKWVEVVRATEVCVYGWDRLERRVVLTVKGRLARTMQHEIDHLDGVLIIDRM